MSAQAKSIRVLLAEDEDAVAELTQAVLAHEARIEIVGRARNGTEAVALAQELSPDLVLMDVVMPELDGIEATRQIRTLRPGIQILILSASTVPDFVARSEEAGAIGFVAKQKMGQELVAAILAAVG